MFGDNTHSIDTHLFTDNGAAALSISTSTIRSGARSMRANTTAATAYWGLPTTITSRVGRVFIRFATLPSADTILLFVTGSGTRGAVAFAVSDNTLRAGTSLGTYAASGIVATTDRWYQTDWKWDDAADTMSVAIDNVAMVDMTGCTGTLAAGGIRFGVGIAATCDVFFDDLVLSNTLSDFPIGGGTGGAFVTISDGTHVITGTGDFQRGNTAVDILNATTTAWQLIDDAPLPSGAVTEADCWRAVAPVNGTDYPEAIFGPASGTPAPILPPRAVEVILAHHQIATGAGSMDVGLNDNGTVDLALSLSGAAGVVTYRYARKHYALAPTGGAWTLNSGAGNFRNLRVRFRSADANPDQCLDAIMIEADFPYYKPRPPLFVNQSVNRAGTY